MARTELLAKRFDAYLSIDVGWRRGDAREFAEWLRRYEVRGLGLDDRFRTLLRESGADEAISECGGGSDIVSWFALGPVVIGIPNTAADGWAIPVEDLAEMPDIELASEAR